MKENANINLKKLVVLSGAGLSQESGLATFRGADGLWEGHEITEVASIDAWYRNPDLVLEFYNKRRSQLLTVQPNMAHKMLAKLEDSFEVQIITQNVDDLHERAGSSSILHLHGQLLEVKSESNDHYVLSWTKDLKLGDLAEDGSQLRPNIVWFGEQVPLIEPATEACADADILVIIGTSLQVYPAAGLVQYVSADCLIYIIDPDHKLSINSANVKHIQEKAVEGMRQLEEILCGKS